MKSISQKISKKALILGLAYSLTLPAHAMMMEEDTNNSENIPPQHVGASTKKPVNVAELQAQVASLQQQLVQQQQDVDTASIDGKSLVSHRTSGTALTAGTQMTAETFNAFASQLQMQNAQLKQAYEEAKKKYTTIKKEKKAAKEEAKALEKQNKAMLKELSAAQKSVKAYEEGTQKTSKALYRASQQVSNPGLSEEEIDQKIGFLTFSNTPDSLAACYQLLSTLLETEIAEREAQLKQEISALLVKREGGQGVTLRGKVALVKSFFGIEAQQNPFVDALSKIQSAAQTISQKNGLFDASKRTAAVRDIQDAIKSLSEAPALIKDLSPLFEQFEALKDEDVNKKEGEERRSALKTLAEKLEEK